MRAGVGLCQGCSASPILFRWVLQDCIEALHKRLCLRNGRLQVDADTLAHLAWADDAWGVSEDMASLNTMLIELSVHAEAAIGSEIRWGKCKLAIDGESKEIEVVIDPVATPMLATVSRVHRGESLTWLGATVHIGGQNQASMYRRM